VVTEIVANQDRENPATRRPRLALTTLRTVICQRAPNSAAHSVVPDVRMDATE
jgi:hypothetical protein